MGKLPPLPLMRVLTGILAAVQLRILRIVLGGKGLPRVLQ
jgi:hypothetical protein